MSYIWEHEQWPALRWDDHALAGLEQPADTDPLLVAGFAHLWFVTLHPFDDGNGRIARAIADGALARSEQTGQRFYSMSGQIRAERNDYYDLLERTQKANIDITGWPGHGTLLARAWI